MKRREMLAGLAGGALAAGCSTESEQSPSSPATAAEVRRWKMVTAWPPNFPGSGYAAEFLARTIEDTSGGRIRVQVFAAGELVPAFEVFDAVSRGTAELGHAVPIYWKGKIPAAQFFNGIPFGMLPMEFNAWIYYGGGQELWDEVYAPFNLQAFSAGNTGPQMGGWFRREINEPADFAGLKMRVPGLGGEVLKRAGATPVNLPGGELFTALQTGAIDATEWSGPYNDLAFGLHRVAPYYYYPGWHEPAGTLECLVNKDVYEGLPDDLRAIIRSACLATNEIILSEFTARNQSSLRVLVEEHEVKLRRFPDAVLRRLREITVDVISELSAADPQARRVAESYQTFQRDVRSWGEISTVAYLEASALDRG